jgi:hypothetical protein
MSIQLFGQFISQSNIIKFLVGDKVGFHVLN